MSISRGNWSTLSSLAKQWMEDDEEEQIRERRRRNRDLGSTTSRVMEVFTEPEKSSSNPKSSSPSAKDRNVPTNKTHPEKQQQCQLTKGQDKEEGVATKQEKEDHKLTSKQVGESTVHGIERVEDRQQERPREKTQGLTRTREENQNHDRPGKGVQKQENQKEHNQLSHREQRENNVSKSWNKKCQEPRSSTEQCQKPGRSTEKVQEPRSSTQKYQETGRSTEKHQEPGRSTEKVQEPRSSTEKYQETGLSTEKYQEPRSSTEKYQEPQSSTEKYQEPQSSTEKYQEPGRPIEKYQEPGCPIEKVQEPRSSTEKYQESGRSTEKRQDPGRSTEKVQEPRSSTEKNQEPQSSTEKFQEPGRPIEKDQEPRSSTEKYQEPGRPIEKYQQPGRPIEKYQEPGRSTAKCQIQEIVKKMDQESSRRKEENSGLKTKEGQHQEMNRQNSNRDHKDKIFQPPHLKVQDRPAHGNNSSSSSVPVTATLLVSKNVVSSSSTTPPSHGSQSKYKSQVFVSSVKIARRQSDNSDSGVRSPPPVPEEPEEEARTASRTIRTEVFVPSLSSVVPNATQNSKQINVSTSPQTSTSFRRLTPLTSSVRTLSQSEDRVDSGLIRSSSLRLSLRSPKIEDRMEKYTSAIKKSSSIRIPPSQSRGVIKVSDGVASKRSIFEKEENPTKSNNSIKDIKTGDVANKRSLWQQRSQSSSDTKL